MRCEKCGKDVPFTVSDKRIGRNLCPECRDKSVAIPLTAQQMPQGAQLGHRPISETGRCPKCDYAKKASLPIEVFRREGFLGKKSGGVEFRVNICLNCGYAEFFVIPTDLKLLKSGK